jgi:hypothetical protein
MRRLDRTGRRCHWILEIHLVDRDRQIGGFHEDFSTSATSAAALVSAALVSASRFGAVIGLADRSAPAPDRGEDQGAKL